MSSLIGKEDMMFIKLTTVIAAIVTGIVYFL